MAKWVRRFTINYISRCNWIYPKRRMCDIFRSKFRLLKSYELSFMTRAEEVIAKLGLPVDQSEPLLKRLYRNSMAVILILELLKGKTKSKFCVVNTHILANNKFQDVNMWQLASLLEGLEQINKMNIPIVLCGDLNIYLKSHQHEFLVQGKVHFPSSEDKSGICKMLAKLSNSIPLPVALILGVPVENIFANQLLFGNSGEFVGFDESEPTSRSGGKAVAVQQLRKGYKKMVMIGDGATDLEAREPGGADLFICYGGVQLRDAVAAKADWWELNPRPIDTTAKSLTS